MERNIGRVCYLKKDFHLDNGLVVKSTDKLTVLGVTLCANEAEDEMYKYYNFNHEGFSFYIHVHKVRFLDDNVKDKVKRFMYRWVG